MKRSGRSLWHALIIASFTLSSTAFAADDPPPREPKPAPADHELDAARKAIAQKDWEAAGEVLQKAVARDPGNATYHNLYAYSMRNGATPSMDLVFKHYSEALRLDPRHRGAHEYIGEAYLIVGNLAKAKEHLSALDKLCFMPCDEYTELKKAVAQYEAKDKR